MAKRKIIKIDEEKCNGCGVCIPNCPEGALQVIDNKARLISDIFCDGLGACIGHCPQEAITTEEREAEEYDEKKTMENIVKAGKNTIIAHLNHLKDHGEMGYYDEALEVLEKKGIEVNFDEKPADKCANKPQGCPGASVIDFSDEKKAILKKVELETLNSDNGQYNSIWYRQMHLIYKEKMCFLLQIVLPIHLLIFIKTI